MIGITSIEHYLTEAHISTTLAIQARRLIASCSERYIRLNRYMVRNNYYILIASCSIG